MVPYICVVETTTGGHPTLNPILEARQIGKDLAEARRCYLSPGQQVSAFALADALSVCGVPVNLATLTAGAAGWSEVTASL